MYTPLFYVHIFRPNTVLARLLQQSTSRLLTRLKISYSTAEAPIAVSQRFLLGSIHFASLGIHVAFEFSNGPLSSVIVKFSLRLHVLFLFLPN